ncbi:uncharacterized protein LOC112489078 [Ziziphus jujuba]|uniref:Uncharacterized protein LOC112489078 n=1 Tax=Ziziphus jujuba TaxID=326968 RepID=A0ABM4AD90_ZIZJJ|nr:uncharacterized protein LOC112489078 [Ziziphus jujuba]
MATVYLHDKEKQEPFLDKQSIIDNPEGSNKERGLASDQHNINIIEIPKDLEPHPPQETCWIHRVPKKLRNINKEAYTPQLVSIGPLHYGNPKLKAMQLHKIKYEEEFSERDFCKHIRKEEWMKFMEKKKEKRKGKKQKRKNHTPVNVPTYLPKLNEKCVRDDFILKIAAELFLEYYKFGRPLASGAAATTSEAAAAASESTFLGIFHPEKKIKCDEFKQISIKHFTDLVRYFMLPVDWKKNKPFRDSGVHCLYSATQLDRARVKFRRGDEEARLADIKKKGGLCWLNGCCLNLQVPELSVKDNIECIMTNVMALDQFVYPREPLICNYVFLLDQLISTEEDVQFLIDKKIVSN